MIVMVVMVADRDGGGGRAIAMNVGLAVGLALLFPRLLQQLI
jgi:hypothetical protein